MLFDYRKSFFYKSIAPTIKREEPHILDRKLDEETLDDKCLSVRSEASTAMVA